MKIKATRKDINRMYRKVYSAGYCDLQFIMNGVEARFYNCGIYGWNWDCYTNSEKEIAITTGYRNTTGKRIPTELIKKYSKIAENLMGRISRTAEEYDEKMRKLEKNRSAFYAELATI